MMTRSRGVGVLSVGLSLLAPSVSPCTCTEFPSFAEVARSAAVVLVVRVAAQGKLKRERLYPELNVAYVDAELIGITKGKDTRRSVRVWDPSFGTSCSYDWRPLVAGTFVAFAADQNDSSHQDQWAALGIEPGHDDYLVDGCGIRWKVLASKQEAEALVTAGRAAEQQDAADDWLRTCAQGDEPDEVRAGNGKRGPRR